LPTRYRSITALRANRESPNGSRNIPGFGDEKLFQIKENRPVSANSYQNWKQR
jgi:hypothetical protein